jgi:sugar (pentulose or hexulose) kinase
MDSHDLLGGLDVGTTSVKAVLMTPDGVEVAYGRAPTVWTSTPQGVEADPYAIADAAIEALSDALAAVPESTVSALGVASMAEAGVLVGPDDSPLAPVIAWHDSRDTAQLADLETQLGGARFSLQTGLPLWTQWSLTKHRWLHENAPHTRGAVRRYNIAEWVVRQLGGRPATELSLASRTGWLDLATGAPWDESLEWAGASRSMLGELVSAGTPFGHVSADHALQQVRRATLTVAGHDHQAAVIGAGAIGDNDELDSCGTAEALLRTIAPQLPDAAIATLTDAGVTIGWHAVRDRWCVLGATQGGLILQQVMAHLGEDRDGLPALDDAALRSRAGAASVTVPGEGQSPVYAGSRAPGDVWKAATDMVTQQARALSDVISDATGSRGDLVVTGGWSHSAALMTAKADALGPLWRTSAGEAGARGAALVAGLAHQTYASYADMPQAPRIMFSRNAVSH